MSVFLDIQREQLHIVVWKKEETLEQLYQLLQSKSTELKAQCEHLFTNESRKIEWITVRLLLFQLLGESCSIEYHSNGEPFLKNDSHFISISHTSGYVCLALHPKRHIGVDIEAYSERINRIVTRVYTSREATRQVLSPADAVWYNLLVWSIKETMFKLLDIPILDYHHGIIVSPFSLEESGETDTFYQTQNYRYYFRANYLRTSDFVLTWCVE